MNALSYDRRLAALPPGTRRLEPILMPEGAALNAERLERCLAWEWEIVPGSLRFVSRGYTGFTVELVGGKLLSGTVTFFGSVMAGSRSVMVWADVVVSEAGG